MLKGNYLATIFLFYQGLQVVLSRQLFVSHGGHNSISCGHSTLPCRSVRFALNISHSGDEILIDHAQGYRMWIFTTVKMLHHRAQEIPNVYRYQRKSDYKM